MGEEWDCEGVCGCGEETLIGLERGSMLGYNLGDLGSCMKLYNCCYIQAETIH